MTGIVIVANEKIYKLIDIKDWSCKFKINNDNDIGLIHDISSFVIITDEDDPIILDVKVDVKYLNILFQWGHISFDSYRYLTDSELFSIIKNKLHDIPDEIKRSIVERY